jgi:hypothetical protein
MDGQVSLLAHSIMNLNIIISSSSTVVAVVVITMVMMMITIIKSSTLRLLRLQELNCSIILPDVHGFFCLADCIGGKKQQKFPFMSVPIQHSQLTSFHQPN